MYAGRLIAMIISSFVIGVILYEKYKNSFREMANYFIKLYVWNVLLGMVIYVLFPSSPDFWMFLSYFGVVFHGDPHSGRFVSLYFDPNFYGAIGSFPFLLSLSVYRNTGEKKDLWTLCLFIIAIFLTLSRSGITTFAFVVGWIIFQRFLKTDSFFVRSRMLWLLLGSGVFLGVFFAFRLEQAAFFIERFISMKDDVSALGRWHSFLCGLEVLRDHPILGVGYEYLRSIGVKFTAIDSSVLSTFVFWGVPTSVAFFSWVGFWLLQSFRKVDQVKRYFSEFSVFYKNMIFYVFVCIVFSSQFNNLLYYQFWFMPILVMFSYMSCFLKGISRTSQALAASTL
jgi:hypothetical protein